MVMRESELQLAISYYLLESERERERERNKFEEIKSSVQRN